MNHRRTVDEMNASASEYVTFCFAPFIVCTVVGMLSFRLGHREPFLICVPHFKIVNQRVSTNQYNAMTPANKSGPVAVNTNTPL